MEKHKAVTFGVSTCGNTEALCNCLTSVLTGILAPAVIQIRFEGNLPAFGNFYLEQLSCLARIRGIAWDMYVDKSKGVRYARDFHVANCPTELLWMGDDDVVYAPDCLEHLMFNVGELGIAYYNGVKVDVSNLRGYKDYNTDVYPTFPAPGSPLNHFYVGTLVRHEIQGIMDTGNVILNLDVCKNNGLRFSMFPDSANAGGEDTLFAAKVKSLGLKAFAVPTAIAFHLEKPKAVFNEFEARKELIKRSKQCLGI